MYGPSQLGTESWISFTQTLQDRLFIPFIGRGDIAFALDDVLLAVIATRAHFDFCAAGISRRRGVEGKI